MHADTYERCLSMMNTLKQRKKELETRERFSDMNLELLEDALSVIERLNLVNNNVYEQGGPQSKEELNLLIESQNFLALEMDYTFELNVIQTKEKIKQIVSQELFEEKE